MSRHPLSTMTGDILQALRKQAHITQREAARRLGCSPNQYAMMERGEKPITRPTAILARLVLKARPPERLEELLDE